MNIEENLNDWADLFESNPSSEKKMHAAMCQKHLDASKELAAKILADGPKSYDEMKSHPLWGKYREQYKAAIDHARKEKAIPESIFEEEMPSRLSLILNAATKVLAGSFLTSKEQEEIAHA